MWHIPDVRLEISTDVLVMHVWEIPSVHMNIGAKVLEMHLWRILIHAEKKALRYLSCTHVWQILTAGALLWALYRPLGKRALFPGWRADVRWRLPSLQSAINFVAYAGPIAGVLITKVIIYGVHACYYCYC